MTQAGRKKSLTGYAQAVNFESWLLNNVSPDDFVVVKLDIEGAEHEIMEKLLESSYVQLRAARNKACHTALPMHIYCREYVCGNESVPGIP